MKTNHRSNKPRRDKSQTEQTVRIIAGEWRGRRITFPSLAGLRPSTDRVRETLFNWLMYDTAGARCLDLFCGSGVLGLEALSRGAQSLVSVDRSVEVARQLSTNANLLKTSSVQVIQSDVLTWLNRPGEHAPFDLVFLDPPFRQSLLEPCLQALVDHRWLSDQALIYVECEKELGPIDVPSTLHLLKEKGAGQVIYRLYRAQVPSQSTGQSV